MLFIGFHSGVSYWIIIAAHSLATVLRFNLIIHLPANNRWLYIRCTISHFHDLCVLLVLGQASWLYNGGTYQFIAATGGHSVHLVLVQVNLQHNAISSWMGREWEFSFRLGMRPCILFFGTSYSSNSCIYSLSNWSRKLFRWYATWY